MVLGFAANLLNRLKWTKRLPESEVVILHRGAPKDRKMIKGDHITEIRKGSFSYMDFDSKKESHIPMHRVLEIWMDEKVVWKKRVKKAPSKAKKPKEKPKSKKSKAKKTKPAKKRASKLKIRGKK